MIKPMRFYSVHRTCEAGASAGFEFFTNQRAAEKAAAAWRKDNPNENAKVESIDVMPTKAGILRALQRFAGHPDNG